MYHLEGAAKAAKNMADRRFARFEGDIKVINEMKMFDKDNYQLVKELKRDVEETSSSMRRFSHIWRGSTL